MMSTFQIYFWEFSTILKISMLCLILAHVRQKRNMMCAKTCAIILILLIIHFYSLINQGFMLMVKKETTTNAIVCHENNLKQLEFWFFGKHVFFILCGFVCFRKCYFLIKYEAIFFFKFLLNLTFEVQFHQFSVVWIYNKKTGLVHLFSFYPNLSLMMFIPYRFVWG